MTSLAKRSILEQARYIAEQGGSPQNAELWLERVLGCFDALSSFPRRCPLVSESEESLIEIRMLNIDGFLLLFDVDDGSRLVRVIAARHGRQLPRQ